MPSASDRPAAAAQPVPQAGVTFAGLATAIGVPQDVLRRAAELLSRLPGLCIGPARVDDLASRGLLQPSRTCRKRPLFRVADLHALASGALTRALLTEMTSSGSQPSPDPVRSPHPRVPSGRQTSGTSAK